MDNSKILGKLKGKLIVSCQALEGEPFHGAEMMAKMALAAEQGGAEGIRSNGYEDIVAIRKVTKLPIIGLIKRRYENSSVYITPTKREIDALLKAGVNVIALDCTKRKRPNGEKLQDLIPYIQNHNTLVLADISTIDEGLDALDLGVDCVSTTLSGYTEYTNTGRTKPDFKLVEELTKQTRCPVFAEGRINTPQEAKQMLEKGAHAVIVGTAITRPQLITKAFVEGINEKSLKA
ncbi:N-acetylmannosamine-6-phosphate 2-epimerase [Aquibacillus sp. 3ASR75-11]|uniref:Putative N-acetylmannosamine-6-phosphate 2-epimerase n=1 Tax=Terrihalobacillus insolitus TaxID=2950438 RepID=A0A9X3WUL8_9BACI|nr:N-acetylmannosamine-6-phosphate 2-epimerase [Terrihalobacillus insolitus]MDC3413817.1 N-acetylmannosamine-6-phosphate 2-epimerase [Terrihalobacillus insolitus]MDC3424536.1 N-acetylmannosamine-6-phosphate 2-epimerase [Terrihalobacillus insolitus]